MSIARTGVRELRRYRQFYEFYPQIGESVTPVSGEQLISSLSFTHISELLQIDDDTKRGFYEIECIEGHWSVRELKRQINSLYFERSGLSFDKGKLAIIAKLICKSSLKKGYVSRMNKPMEHQIQRISSNSLPPVPNDHFVRIEDIRHKLFGIYFLMIQFSHVTGAF